MATNGKLDAKFTVPSGGWSMSCTDALGGPTTVTLPAGEYYHSSVGSLSEDLADALTTAANAPTVMGATWTFSVSAGESGTGIYTISQDGATCTVTFTDVELRDAMGFTGNLSGSTSYNSTNAAKGLWLPGSVYHNLNGGAGWGGWWESDKQEVETASGHYYALMGRKKRVMSLDWHMVAQAKTWVANETTVGASFEQFLIDAIYGEASGFATGGPLRWHPDADTDGTYKTYSVAGFQSWRPPQERQDFVGRWHIVFERLVEVPS